MMSLREVSQRTGIDYRVLWMNLRTGVLRPSARVGRIAVFQERDLLRVVSRFGSPGAAISRGADNV
jgi:predicted site-specific integrase-resolvase